MYCRRHALIKSNCYACSDSSTKACHVCTDTMEKCKADCAACKVIEQKTLSARMKLKKIPSPLNFRMFSHIIRYSNRLLAAESKTDCSLHAVAKNNCKVCVLAKALMPNSPNAFCSKHIRQTRSCGHCIRKKAFYKRKQLKPKVMLKAKS